MVKITVTPHTNYLSLTIPDSYIGKDVEILCYAVDELREKQGATNRSARFKGILTEEEGLRFHAYLKEAR